MKLSDLTGDGLYDLLTAEGFIVKHRTGGTIKSINSITYVLEPPTVILEEAGSYTICGPTFNKKMSTIGLANKFPGHCVRFTKDKLKTKYTANAKMFISVDARRLVDSLRAIQYLLKLHSAEVDGSDTV